ncbi:hypothetical protein M885DRAFT_617067 [Pelagophyceae sp. CCMP2097]|nr:hypothetical protein M885DRAFT_617067 [Pelagophyceae sp. CCMP2097]|mmetsp:Transcript_17060/g.57634  ORF Transcript_17060/g.57634 Transcript_17060/m.57634 type:complete len:197 (-) Transcript_17060:111-701(-)
MQEHDFEAQQQQLSHRALVFAEELDLEAHSKQLYPQRLRVVAEMRAQRDSANRHRWKTLASDRQPAVERRGSPPRGGDLAEEWARLDEQRLAQEEQLQYHAQRLQDLDSMKWAEEQWAEQCHDQWARQQREFEAQQLQLEAQKCDLEAQKLRLVNVAEAQAHLAEQQALAKRLLDERESAVREEEDCPRCGGIRRF